MPDGSNSPSKFGPLQFSLVQTKGQQTTKDNCNLLTMVGMVELPGLVAKEKIETH